MARVLTLEERIDALEKRLQAVRVNALEKHIQRMEEALSAPAMRQSAPTAGGRQVDKPDISQS